MNNYLKELINILEEKGYHKYASKVKERTVKIKTDPLSTAVALGFLNPSVLEEVDDIVEDNEEELYRDFLKKLQSEDPENKF